MPESQSQIKRLKIQNDKMTCPKCGKVKRISSYPKLSKREYIYLGNELKPVCKRCMGVRYKHTTEGKARYYKHKYGLEWDSYVNMLAKQDNKCLGCGRLIYTEINSNSPAYVDHDHMTGEIRGLLCRNCNTALGQVNDNKEILLNLVKYLEGL